jgi:hypothetical protein
MAADTLNLTRDEAQWFVISDKLNRIKPTILSATKFKSSWANGEIIPLSIASDNLNISTLSKPVTKYADLLSPLQA